MIDIGVKNIMGVYYLSKESEKAEGVAWYKNAYNSCKAIARKYKHYKITLREMRYFLSLIWLF